MRKEGDFGAWVPLVLLGLAASALQAQDSTLRLRLRECIRVTVRLDTPREREYLRHGGILPFVLRRLLAS